MASDATFMSPPRNVASDTAFDVDSASPSPKRQRLQIEEQHSYTRSFNDSINSFNVVGNLLTSSMYLTGAMPVADFSTSVIRASSPVSQPPFNPSATFIVTRPALIRSPSPSSPSVDENAAACDGYISDGERNSVAGDPVEDALQKEDYSPPTEVVYKICPKLS